YEILQFLFEGVAWSVTCRGNNECFYYLPTIRIGNSDHGAFLYRRMLQQDVLNFNPCNVVTRTDNQVIGARLEPEVPVWIHAKGVAGEVPSVLHILSLLARTVQILASGDAANG